MKNYIFTSESVTEGHPDKVCDKISDTILDEYLKQDNKARVAIETAVKNNTVVLLGEISSTAKVDIEKVVRKTINDIGYNNDELGFNGNTAEIILRIDKQSEDIKIGVDDALEVREEKEKSDIGAGDQGMVFGFATNETSNYMPLPITLAHNLAKRLEKVRKTGQLTYLRPDAKTQVSVRYEDDKPKSIDVILVSTQHDPDKKLEDIKNDVINYVIKPTIPGGLINDKTKIIVNPTGRFVIGGPVGDSGLTGRKIIVDTYGGYSKHGGGAFSGKDGTKVDRSAAYAARHAAKNIVAAGLADKAEIQIAYAIGVANPVSILVDTFGTSKVPENEIEKAVKELFDFRPQAIIERLNLDKPIYKNLATYGHIGREDLNVKWEETDYVDKLKKYFNL